MYNVLFNKKEKRWKCKNYNIVEALINEKMNGEKINIIEVKNSVKKLRVHISPSLTQASMFPNFFWNKIFPFPKN